MKQKVVVKVNMNENKKARTKALKIAVSVHGVESASLQGPDKDQIAVTGEGIDSVELTILLRKNVGRTELVTVGPVEDKTNNPAVVQTNSDHGSGVLLAHPHTYYTYTGIPMTPLHIYEVPHSEPPPCSIM